MAIGWGLSTLSMLSLGEGFLLLLSYPSLWLYGSLFQAGRVLTSAIGAHR